MRTFDTFFFFFIWNMKWNISKRVIEWLKYIRDIFVSSGWLILKQRRRKIKRFFYLYFYLVFNQELRNLEEKQCKYSYLLEINTIEWKEEIISSKIKFSYYKKCKIFIRKMDIILLDLNMRKIVVRNKIFNIITFYK